MFSAWDSYLASDEIDILSVDLALNAHTIGLSRP